MNESKQPKAELPIMLIESQEDWAAWLEEHHTSSGGVWLQHAKKDSGQRSVSYAEALDVALCYGWIDGQKKAFDQSFWVQKWTPRGKKSIWSKINRDKAERLIAEGRMQPAGQRMIDAARADGRWDAAYDSATNSTVPEDFQAALDANEVAKAFFATLNRQNRYAILFRIQTAKKPETRAKRIQQFITMLEKQEKVYP